MPPPDRQDPSPQELAADQRRREQVEQERTEGAVDDGDAREHARRAEKAGYLRGKLEEQVESDRDAGG